ncbi:hypothetical protein [Chryseobacterium sp.]|jgi:hypothetical protein|uniref:hypothetical protein n=1 Tax=Chryseobacterium sp. TaxID=1871047 RepID=UPI00283D2D2B|nr:hypothetical protein [Chryseobacterium sp.]MDR3026037.1 hypothetical protein [Chryseobacterium sp.]
MKQLQLDLKERLLIVELPNKDCEFGGLLKNRNLYFFTEKMNSQEDYPVCYPLPYDCEFICLGSKITEDIAKGFSVIVRNSHNEQGFIDYKCEQDEIVYDPGFITAVHSFISAIESKGFHWGESKGLIKYKHVPNSPMYKESESRTLNPTKCLIFKLL